MRNIFRLFQVPVDQPELTESQLRAFSKQIPLLYLILIANTAFVAATHIFVAPVYLTVVLPLMFSALCAVRLVSWWRMRGTHVDHRAAIERLRSTIRLVGVFGLIFILWGFAMFPYGDTFQKSHVVFYMSITTVACVFCLMHVRAAALALALMVTIPMTLFLASQGEMVLSAIAANNVLVAAAMIFIVFTHYRDFAQMIRQQGELRRKQNETQKLSDDNFRLANCDSLTGIANRRSFFAAISGSLKAAAGSPFAVGLIDLDGFKAVNDLYGHATGDELLIEASKRMQSMASDTVTFARLGGDEFGIVISTVNTSIDLQNFGLDLCALLRRPYLLSGLTVDISASAGFAIYPDGGLDVEILVEHADYALYQAKQSRAGQPVIFTGEHAHDIKYLNLVDHTLRNVDFETELRLDYQPIFEPATGSVRAFEALARWTNPTLGKVAPSIFIKAAERSDLINRLTTTLFRKALDQLATWPAEVSLSFNLSARTIASPAAILHLTKLIMKSGVSPRRIEFEVTETAIMVDFTQALQTLATLKATGAKIALDDFGSGYSSLGYVHRLPLDKIKIDSAFIADIEDNLTVRNIVKTIVDLSHNLGLSCVAEGVETSRQAEIIRDLGCSLVQGFYFGRPGKAEDFLGKAAAQQPWEPAVAS